MAKKQVVGIGSRVKLKGLFPCPAMSVVSKDEHTRNGFVCAWFNELDNCEYHMNYMRVHRDALEIV